MFRACMRYVNMNGLSRPGGRSHCLARCQQGSTLLQDMATIDRSQKSQLGALCVAATVKGLFICAHQILIPLESRVNFLSMSVTADEVAQFDGLWLLKLDNLDPALC